MQYILYVVTYIMFSKHPVEKIWGLYLLLKHLNWNYSLDPKQDLFVLKVMLLPGEVMLGVPPVFCVTV